MINLTIPDDITTGEVEADTTPATPENTPAKTGDDKPNPEEEEKPSGEEKPNEEDKPNEEADKGTGTEEEPEEVGASAYLAHIYGIEGEFGDDEEGVKGIAEALIERGRAEGRKEGAKDVNEIAIKLDAHLKAGYSFESFFMEQTTPDLSQVELEELDDDKNKQVYDVSLQIKGIDEETRKEMVDSAKKAGNLYNKAVKGLAEVQAYNKKQIDDKKAEEKKLHDDAVEKVKSTIKEINDTLDAGNLAGFDVAKAKTSELKKFVLEKDDKGVTARDKAYQALTTSQKLFLDLLVMSNFDIKSLSVAQQQAKSTGKKVVLKGSSASNKKKDETPIEELSTGRNPKVGYQGGKLVIF